MFALLRHNPEQALQHAAGHLLLLFLALYTVLSAPNYSRSFNTTNANTNEIEFLWNSDVIIRHILQFIFGGERNGYTLQKLHSAYVFLKLSSHRSCLNDVGSGNWVHWLVNCNSSSLGGPLTSSSLHQRNLYKKEPQRSPRNPNPTIIVDYHPLFLTIISQLLANY